MTITDNGRSDVDELTLRKARAFVADVGGMPSKREMQKHLGKRWEVVNEVLTRLGTEARQASEARRREARQALRRLPGRKRSGSTRVILAGRQRTVNAPTLTVAEDPVLGPFPVTEPEAVGKHPEPVAQAVNEKPRRRPVTWPIYLLALPAFAAVWSGWVGLGGLTGFGLIQPFPGIPVLDGIALDTRITLPIGVETYAAYALYVWLSGAAPRSAKRFAMWSAIGSLIFGAAGQVAFHLMEAWGMTVAPWQITTIVSCLPVAVLGMGAALRHLVHAEEVSN
jgi:hypothetical protein